MYKPKTDELLWWSLENKKLDQILKDYTVNSQEGELGFLVTYVFHVTRGFKFI